LNTLAVEAGKQSSLEEGRMGRRTSSPPQFGHLVASFPTAQSEQKVHSNEQIMASGESAGRSRSQHSQEGRSCSMVAGAVGSISF